MDRRREYITGFTGSAGTALICLPSASCTYSNEGEDVEEAGQGRAFCFVDSRYYIQAAQQLSKWWTMVKIVGAGEEGVGSVKAFLEMVSDPFKVKKNTRRFLMIVYASICPMDAGSAWTLNWQHFVDIHFFLTTTLCSTLKLHPSLQPQSKHSNPLLSPKNPPTHPSSSPSPPTSLI